MISLHDIERALAGSIVGDAPPIAVPSWIADDAPSGLARLQVYRNHYRITLIEVLASTFPVVQRLIGDPCFRAVGRDFVLAQPPRDPRLTMYGSAFPRYLGTRSELRALPYLAGVARLEWAIHVAWHAADAPALDAEALISALAGATTVRITLHPSCRIVASPFPVDRIWQTHQLECLGDETINIDDDAVHLLVHRRDDEVGWMRLAPADFVFTGALIADGRLCRALALGRAVARDFEAGPLLAALLAGGLISSLSSITTQ